SVNMRNYEQAVPYDWQRLMRNLGYGTEELVVMRDVVAEYETSTLPAYVVFITDGGFYDTSNIKKFMTDASYLPIFWQFVGVNGSGYGLLEELDNMNGRYVDNANFFALDDFRRVDNKELYSRLLNEFPTWLKLCKSNGVLDGSARSRRSNPPAPPQGNSFTDRIKNIFGF
ncbi:MAG: VWA domain-containing protein, partial [Selenomonadaceae bacterium]|nr:VWA domain-containing protein [Selenomonadaceae bacterium]